MLRRSLVLSVLLFLCVQGARAEGRPACTGMPAGVGGISTLRITLANVPAILRVPGTVTKPPIILWHGFGAPSSEGELMEALPLDEVPSVKVYLGLPLFGARAPAAARNRSGSDRPRTTGRESSSR